MKGVVDVFVAAGLLPLLLLRHVNEYYLAGVNPHSFREGDL